MTATSGRPLGRVAAVGLVLLLLAVAPAGALSPSALGDTMVGNDSPTAHDSPTGGDPSAGSDPSAGVAANGSLAVTEAPFGGDRLVPGSRFRSALVPPETHASTVVLRHWRPARGVTGTAERSVVGSDFRLSAERELDRDPGDPVRTVTVEVETPDRLDDAAVFRKYAYPAGERPDALLEHRLVRGNRSYARLDRTGADLTALAYDDAVEGFEFYRTGTVRHDGERLVRYRAVGRRGEVLSRFTGTVAGYALVDEAGVLRYTRLRVPERGGYLEVVFEPHPDANVSRPDWLATARTVPPDPEYGDAPGVPRVRAYEVPGGILLRANGSWTPPAGARVAVFDAADEPLGVARLNASRPLFADGNRSRVLLRPTDDGLAVERTVRDDLSVRSDRPLRERLRFTDGDRVIVDASGVNYYDEEAGRTEWLGSVDSVLPARLAPSNGGGRVLRVEGLQVDPDVDLSTPVTLTVGNDSVAQSATLSAADVSGSRVFLVRTSEGLRAVPRRAVAPDLDPPGGFAGERFPADATLTVAVDGVPVSHVAVDRRLTRAATVPVDRLATGITVRRHEERPLNAPDDESGTPSDDGDRDYVSVHVWDHDAVFVRGDLALDGPRCEAGETCYYRAPAGTVFRVETSDGRVLYRGTVGGSSDG